MKIKDTSLESLVYFLELSPTGEAVLTPISETNKIKSVDDENLEFTKKWAFSESVLKCCGTGFLGAANVNELSMGGEKNFDKNKKCGEMTPRSDAQV